MSIRNLCVTCNKDFASVEGFDNHRVGKHAFTYSEGLRMDPMREDGRRCLDTDEMRLAGYAQDVRGRWGQVSRQERARKAFLGDAPASGEVSA